MAVRHPLAKWATLAILAILAATGFAADAGDAAPDFDLPGSDGQAHALADYRGRFVVLAYFPKAFTGG